MDGNDKQNIFWEFYGKVFETLVGCNIGNDYVCLCDLLYFFEEPLSFFEFGNFY